MTRKSKTEMAAASQTALTATEPSALSMPAHADLKPALQRVVGEIDRLFGDIQTANVTTYWRVGKLLTEVRDDPDKYLTEQQQASHIDGAGLLISIFAPVYSVEQLRSAMSFFERYPSESELRRLLGMRCPERPRWRITASHVQLLSQIPDDTQRAAVEERCAEEAYTAKTLAAELQEIRGKQKTSGRTHQAPKGLKQQVYDLLQHQRRFIGRSTSLWLTEKDDDLYNDIMNSPPAKLDTTVLSYLSEIVDNFSQLSDIISNHIAMCEQVVAEIQRREEAAEAASDEKADEAAPAARPKPRSDITR